MPKRHQTTFSVVYNQVGRTPEGGLTITSAEEQEAQVIALPAPKKTSIFGGKDSRSIFSIDKASIFSFSSTLTTKIKSGLSSSSDPSVPKAPKASSAHSFHEDYAGDGDDSDSDTASTVTVGRGPASDALEEVELEKPAPIPDIPAAPTYIAHRRRPGRFLHSLATSTGRIQIVLDSIGAKDRPIYVEGIAPTVAGKVLVTMQPNDEEIVVEVRGIAYGEAIAGGIGQSKGATSHAEETFYEDCQTLWTAESGPPRQGQIREFLFSTEIPSEVPHRNRTVYRAPQILGVPSFPGSAHRNIGLPGLSGSAEPDHSSASLAPMPPTFAVKKDKDDITPGHVHNAFITYEVQISVTRDGGRSKDKLVAPFVYLSQRQDIDFLSQARRHALMEKSVLPFPGSVSAAWHCQKESVSFDKNHFSSIKRKYDIAIFIPAPDIYGRQETLPFHVHITSKEIKQLNKLTHKSMEAVFLQKLLLTVPKTDGKREEVLNEPTLTRAEGVEMLENGEGVVKYSGQITLRSGGVTSFQLYRMHLSYFLMVGFTAPNQLIHWISVPLTIVNIPALVAES